MYTRKCNKFNYRKHIDCNYLYLYELIDKIKNIFEKKKFLLFTIILVIKKIENR